MVSEIAGYIRNDISAEAESNWNEYLDDEHEPVFDIEAMFQKSFMTALELFEIDTDSMDDEQLEGLADMVQEELGDISDDVYDIIRDQHAVYCEHEYTDSMFSSHGIPLRWVI